MTYKLNPEVSKIKSPVILQIKDVESSAEKLYADGEELASATFERNYVVSSLVARENTVVLAVEENQRINATNWIGEEMTECGFF